MRARADCAEKGTAAAAKRAASFDAYLKSAPRRAPLCAAAAAEALSASAADADADADLPPLPPLLPPPGARCGAAFCGSAALDDYWWHGTLAAEALLLGERFGRQLLVRARAPMPSALSLSLSLSLSRARARKRCA
jgi:hypothetical protein